jgi:hypothetical protein
MKFEIKARFSGATLFTAELDAKFDSSSDAVRLGEAVKAAYKSGAYLRGADLRGAYLGGADLHGADLHGADLGGAYLRGADLRGAYLRGADLRGADLHGADLHGADLGGADLGGADLGGAYLRGADLGGAYLRGADLRENKTLKLVGKQPVLQVGPIGSRNDFALAFMTDAGPYVRTGCFFGSLDEFRAAVERTHKGTPHGAQYMMFIAMIEAHRVLWADEAEQQGKVNT